MASSTRLRGDGQRRLDALDARLEVVVEDDRDDGDGEAERRGDQRLGDAGGDHREAAAAHDRHVVEGLDDADDGAEQADERRAAADRAEHPQRPLERLELLEALLLGQIGRDTPSSRTEWRASTSEKMRPAGVATCAWLGLQRRLEVAASPAAGRCSPASVRLLETRLRSDQSALEDDAHRDDREQDQRVGGEPPV